MFQYLLLWEFIMKLFISCGQNLRTGIKNNLLKSFDEFIGHFSKPFLEGARAPFNEPILRNSWSVCIQTFSTYVVFG